MTKIPNNKPVYVLEERTFQFAKAVRLKQVVKSLRFSWCKLQRGQRSINQKRLFDED